MLEISQKSLPGAIHQFWWSPQLISHVSRLELIGLFCTGMDEKMVYSKIA